MKNVFKIGCFAALLLCLGAGCAARETAYGPARTPPAPLPTVAPQPEPAPPAFMAPIADAPVRVTKKPFGLYVTPKDSPVSPERFTGYHAGADFETTADEQATDVPIFAACDGTLALKEYASGYGGVAVERCTLDGAAVTVIYGHLRLSSIQAKAGQALKAGETFAVLGTGYGKETDGERKHLHFGVHKGAAISIKGYVQTKSALADWLDPLPLIR